MPSLFLLSNKATVDEPKLMNWAAAQEAEPPALIVEEAVTDKGPAEAIPPCPTFILFPTYNELPTLTTSKTLIRLLAIDPILADGASIPVTSTTSNSLLPLGRYKYFPDMAPVK